MSCIYNIVCSIVLRYTAQQNASIKASSSALMHCTLLLVSVGGLLQIQDAFVLFDRLTKILQLLYCACGMALLRDSVGALLQRLLKVNHSGHSVISNFAPMCVFKLSFYCRETFEGQPLWSLCVFQLCSTVCSKLFFYLSLIHI